MSAKFNNVSQMPFSVLCEQLDKIARKTKSVQRKKVLHELWQVASGGEDKNLYPLMRLLLPELDRERTGYKMRAKGVAKMYVDCLGWDPKGKQAQRLEKYKDPRLGSTGIVTGDFVSILYGLIEKRTTGRATVTIEIVNKVLDALAKTENHVSRKKVFMFIVTKMTAKEQYWLMRIILRELKMGIRHESMLKEFHASATEIYNVSSSLQKVCAAAANPSASSNSAILHLGLPIKPMLANRKHWMEVIKAMSGAPFAIELKFDGERIQIHFRRNGEMKLFTRNSHDYTTKFGYGVTFQPIINECIKCDSCILDGEMVTWNRETKTFEPFGGNRTVALNKVSDLDDEGKQLCYMAFDILMMNDTAVMDLSLKRRRKLLEKAFDPKPHQFELVHQITDRNDTQGVMKALDEALENRHEGIVVKNLDSNYIPNDRSTKWLKLKPDYVDSMIGHMDLIILAGYFADGNRRAGGISHFLLGLAHENYQVSGGSRSYHAFCKVGTGYSLDALSTLRLKLRPYWRNYDPKKKYSHLMGWTPQADDVPDVWIEPKNSVLVELLGNELVPCKKTKFYAGYTVRFPRAKKFRYDKSWRECMTVKDMHELLKKTQSQVTRKRAADVMKDGGGRSKRRARVAPTVMGIYLPTSTSDMEVKGNIFEGLEFCVLSESQRHPKAEVERKIYEYGGSFVQNPLESTDYVLSAKESLKYHNLVKTGLYDILRFSWIDDCIAAGNVANPEPRHLMFATEITEIKLSKEVDPYGDYFTRDTNIRELAQCFEIVAHKHPELREDTEMNDANSRDQEHMWQATAWGLDHFDEEMLQTEFTMFSRFNVYVDRYDPIGGGEEIPCNYLDLTQSSLCLYGATISKTLDSDVTHVVVDSDIQLQRLRNVRENLTEMKNDPSNIMDKYVVTRTWVEDCIKNGKLLRENNYFPSSNPAIKKSKSRLSRTQRKVK